ncbi:MAG: PAS domain-containing protein [Ignavibacteriales bacterium]|nr:PAS domain-containing protein [Ignavibacteriales bacterium]
MSADTELIFTQPSLFENWFNYLPGLAYRCKNDSEWTMMFVSEGSAELTGYFPKEFTNQEVFMTPSSCLNIEIMWAEIQSHLDRREPFTLEYKILTRSGDIRWVWEKAPEYSTMTMNSCSSKDSLPI